MVILFTLYENKLIKIKDNKRAIRNRIIKKERTQ